MDKLVTLLGIVLQAPPRRENLENLENLAAVDGEKRGKEEQLLVSNVEEEVTSLGNVQLATVTVQLATNAVNQVTLPAIATPRPKKQAVYATIVEAEATLPESVQTTQIPIAFDVVQVDISPETVLKSERNLPLAIATIVENLVTSLAIVQNPRTINWPPPQTSLSSNCNSMFFVFFPLQFLEDHFADCF